MARGTDNARRFSEGTRAIVVGVGDYRGSGLPDLPACPKEAAEIAAALVSPSSWAVPASQVRLIPDFEGTAEGILAAVRDAAGKATADDIVILYFAGHGQNEDGGFILRTGPREADPDRGLSREDLAAALGETRARGVLVFLDCCGGAGFAEHAPEFFYSLADHDFRLLISASRAGQSSWELEDHGSLFTRRLLRVLRGDERFGDDGSIYFSDLFDYLHASVVADAKAAFGGSRLQSPVFAGSHAADPLLFLNRDLTLSQVRVRTTRITPDVLRRRVAGSAGAVLAMALVLVAGYSAFLDSHQYLDVRGDGIALVHGYPGLSGFGLPQDEWVYAEGPGSLRSSDVLAVGRTFVFDRQAQAEKILRNFLNDAARARVDLWLGDRESARRELLGIAMRREFHDGKDLEFIGDVVGQGDKTALKKIVEGLKPGDPVEPVLALKAIDPSAAIGAFGNSTASADLGMRLGLLAKWGGTCTPAIQTWLDQLLSDKRAGLAYGLVAETVTRTSGCVFSVAQAEEASRERVRDAYFALRITNAPGTADLKHHFAGLITESPIRSPETSRQIVGGFAATSQNLENIARFASIWRNLDVGACGEWLLKYRETLDDEAILDAMVAAARDCRGYELAVNADRSPLALSLSSPTGVALSATTPDVSGGPPKSLPTSLLPGETPRAVPLIPLISAILETETRTKREDFLLGGLGQSAAAEDRVFIVGKLRRLGAKPSIPLAFRLPDSPELDRELVRWSASGDVVNGSKEAADLVLDGQRKSAFLGVLALIPLAEPDRLRLLRGADSMDLIPRTIIKTLCGSRDDALDLLNSPDPKVRALAADYLLARPDRVEVLALARRKSRHADVMIARAEARLARIEFLRSSLATTPDFALSWRVHWLQHSEIESEGLSLAFEQLLDNERQSALARP